MSYTRLVDGYWKTSNKKIDQEWEEIQYGQDDNIVAPQGLVDQIRNESGNTLEKACEAATRKMMDDEAKKLNYDDIESAVTYADEQSVKKFKDEGASFRRWRSLVWEQYYVVLNEYRDGMREGLTVEQLVSELPELSIVYT